MCDLPVPCECTLERRKKIRAEHIARSEAFLSIARLPGLTDDQVELLYRQADHEWDDAIHIASPKDPLRSLCGQSGRNLCDLPERPGGGEGCWTCLLLADELAKATQELVTA